MSYLLSLGWEVLSKSQSLTFSKSSPLSFIELKVLCHSQRLSKSFVLQRLQCLLLLHFKGYQSLLACRDFNVFCFYISKTIKVFCLAETSMSSAFTFQRLSMSFVKTIKVFFTFQRLSKSIVLQRLSMSSALYFSKTIRVFCQDFNVFFTFQRLQYPLLRLQHLFYILRLQYLLLLSDPNFVQGLSFANVLILASRIKLFDTSCRARRKIIQHFGKECVKYPKGRSKGSF